MKKSRMISAFFVAVVTFITMSANAAPVLYDEAVGGDIKFDFFFTFDTGTNKISGSSAINSTLVTIDTIVTTDFDIFNFKVAPGTQVNSISYAFSNVAALSGSTTGFGLRMESINGNLGDLQIDVLSNLSPVSILGEILPLGAGSHDFSYSLWSNAVSADPYGVIADPYGGTWDYTLTFEVGAASVIPVPAAAWLFGSGLIGLIGVARRKARA